MVKTLKCSLVSSLESYDIIVGAGLLFQQGHDLAAIASKFAIVTDNQVASLYGKELLSSLSSMGLKSHLFSFPEGEHQKTRETKHLLEDQLFEVGFGRDSCVIALGGGVVTDVSGYLAATYCRGIPLVIIPTSLLAMVDASIGGKTGVNVPYGKNLIGSIYQPKKVIIDPLVLSSLPERELKNGIVEMIKHGLIADSRLFDTLEKDFEALLSLEPVLLEELIVQGCSVKKEIVQEDEKELGKRRLLNFGHTIGHALELASDYSLAHGEAVAIGILVESYLSLKSGYLDEQSFQRIRHIFDCYALPLKLPKKLSIDRILNAMSFDKKSVQNLPRFVMIDQIGSALSFNSNYCTHVENSLLLNTLQWMKDDLCTD